MTMEKHGKIIVLIAEGCLACAELKGEIGNDKRFELMDVTSNPQAKRLAKELGVNAVPTFLSTNKRGGICVLNDDGKAVKCIKNEHQHTKK